MALDLNQGKEKDLFLAGFLEEFSRSKDVTAEKSKQAEAAGFRRLRGSFGEEAKVWNTPAGLSTLKPTAPTHDPKPASNSLLLLLLQLVVSGLLALQQHTTVLQVTGHKVALPLQLLGRLPGCLISTLQLHQLWGQ